MLLVAALCMALVACQDDALTKTAQALNDVALSVGAVQTTVIESNKAGALSEDDTRTVLLLCQKINTAGQQASAITRGLTKLTPAQRGSLTVVIKPVLDAVAQAVNGGLITIKDQGVKTKILAALVTIETALNTVNVILSTS